MQNLHKKDKESSLALEKILGKYNEISLLKGAQAILNWDLNVNLPLKAADFRSEQCAYFAKMLAEKWLDKTFRNLLEAASQQEQKFNSKEKAIIRNLIWWGKYYFNVPKNLIADFSAASSRAFLAWQQANLRDEFAIFSPHLEKLISLNKKIAYHLGFQENPYDALLDLHEPGLTVKECARIFDLLRPNLTSTLRKIKNSPHFKIRATGEKNSFYPVKQQKKISQFILNVMGYDMNAGRMDVSVHPFTTTLGKHDIRITNRYKTSDFLDSLSSAIHEGGHALYEQGIAEEYVGTPLGDIMSLGMHESQSRFWETQVGKSKEFIAFMLPVLQAFYPDQLAAFDAYSLYKHSNRVKPSFIRVEADEVTYNLHIMLRFELEEALINGELMVKDLPGIWREKMREYLGVIPESDREGVLQDTHWGVDTMGYFPSYTLGNLYAAQFTAAIKKQMDFGSLIRNGDFKSILAWLRNNIHCHGSRYLPCDLIKKISGENLNPQYFLDYIENKYSELYA